MVDKQWIQLLTALNLAIALTFPSTVWAKNRHYARSSKDLRELAEMDLKTMWQLKSLKNTLQQDSSLLQSVKRLVLYPRL